MCDFIDAITPTTTDPCDQVLSLYGRFMYLKIYVENPELKQVYVSAAFLHNAKLTASEHIDAGFDLFSPEKEPAYVKDKYKLDFGIKCSATMTTTTNPSFNTGYYMYPRSSLSKTKFRLANCVGIIDSGYRGNLIGVFDVVQSECESYFLIEKHDRLLQICAPALVPIYVEIVDTFEELGGKTERGSGGFGSSGR